MSHALDVLSSLGGVASTAALRDRGVDPHAVRRAVARRDVARIRNGWVALPEAPADVTAAVRVGGALSCVSALRLHRVWLIDDHVLHVRTNRAARHRASPSDRRALLPATQPGVKVHLTVPSSLPSEIVFAVDSLPQSVLHAAHCLDRAQAVAALDSVLNLGLLSRPALADLLGGQIGRVAALLPLVDPGAQSGIESFCRLGLHAARIGARSQVPIDDVGRVDFLVGDRLVIEVDGREHHATQAGFAEDRRRDLALAAKGYLVLRLTYAQVMYQWDEVLATIRGILRRGEHRWSGRHRRDGLVVGVERYR